jgi:hypothetical protein
MESDNAASLDINALHKHQKQRLPGAQMIQAAIEDKTLRVTLFGNPEIMKKLRKHFGDSFIEPKHVPPHYVRGTVHVNIQHERIAKTYLTANMDVSLLW